MNYEKKHKEAKQKIEDALDACVEMIIKLHEQKSYDYGQLRTEI